MHSRTHQLQAVDAWANYVFRRAGVAVSSTPQGPFKPIRALRPNGMRVRVHTLHSVFPCNFLYCSSCVLNERDYTALLRLFR